MMSNDKIVKGLCEIYKMELWHTHKLSESDAKLYHETLLNRGNIISVSDNGNFCGYVECWRLNYEQWGRIICGEPFSAMQEDVQTGWIAYVANTFIKKEYRNTHVIKQLRNRFFELNKDCTFFVGEARRKRCGLIKVFRREDIYGQGKTESDSRSEYYSNSSSYTTGNGVQSTPA